jgi:predicted phosphodiesterase
MAVLAVLLGALVGATPQRSSVALPLRPDSVKFAVIGDNGNGSKEQYETGAQMAKARDRFAFEFVIMLGDNMYGSQEPADFVTKFERPYATLLGANVPFYAALGNHDKQSNRDYPPFGMNGQRYYSFVKKHVRFLVFDTNLMDPPQRQWIEQTLQQAQDDWLIAYFHHPLYSNAGRHGSDLELRAILEPLFVKYNVDVVFSGHEHVYERLKPQRGITYFTEGSSGQLRKGDMRPAPSTAASFDQDQTFMLVEVGGNELTFQTISRAGAVVDAGVVARRPRQEVLR